MLILAKLERRKFQFAKQEEGIAVSHVYTRGAAISILASRFFPTTSTSQWASPVPRFLRCIKNNSLGDSGKNTKAMIRHLLCFAMLFISSLGSIAQTTISYGQISCFCPQTGDMLGGGKCIAVTFYDGYISYLPYGKLRAVSRNADGSTTYVPTGYAGESLLGILNAVLVSSDRSRLEERMTSTYGYQSLNMINTYTTMGADGGRAAQAWGNARAAAGRGTIGSSSNNHNNGTCRSCGGTGVNRTPNTGGSRTSWVAHYNSQGNKCPYCGNYSSHFHDRCASCNVPRY